jgi:hypothetical protein
MNSKSKADRFRIVPKRPPGAPNHRKSLRATIGNITRKKSSSHGSHSSIGSRGSRGSIRSFRPSRAKSTTTSTKKTLVARNMKYAREFMEEIANVPLSDLSRETLIDILRMLVETRLKCKAAFSGTQCSALDGHISRIEEEINSRR